MPEQDSNSEPLHCINHCTSGYTHTYTHTHTQTHNQPLDMQRKKKKTTKSSWDKVVKEADPEMIRILELSLKNFKITILSMLKKLEENGDKMDKKSTSVENLNLE